MKKLFTILSFVLTAVAVSAQTTATVDDIKYILDGSDATVTYPNDSKPNDDTNRSTYTGDVTIPDKVTVDGVTYNVTGIGDYAFRSASITSLTLSEGLVSIGQKAIYLTQQCHGLWAIRYGL